ncbi:MAG TPA: TonB family protein [Polyangia bacterium]|nr:TonB family protein [Polyangia bacterium]
MRKTSNRGSTGWRWAVAASFVVHAGVLGALVLGRARAPAAAESVVVELKADPSGAWDVVAPGEALPDPPLPTVDEAVVARPLDAPQSERDNAVAKTVAPREGDGHERAAPAPDEGANGGRPAALATRRDRASLQTRVADAATDAQSARLRTSRRSASPQAVRRELTAGAGDSVRKSDATRAVSAAAPEAPPAAPPSPADVAGAAPGAKVAARVEPLVLANASEHPTPERGDGPLDVDTGTRQFDVAARGRAADDQNRRAVANDAHPGIADFSRAGVAAPVDAHDGRGPGTAPGAVARATNGAAPAVYGARSPQDLAAEIAERTRERQYDRYRQEIQRRVQNVLVFPKVLALRLEQGEAVVTFIVRPDGALSDGPRIIKSSGFQEFDAEAVKAVQRAAPFPRRGEQSGISLQMPVTFENPLVR